MRNKLCGFFCFSFSLAGFLVWFLWKDVRGSVAPFVSVPGRDQDKIGDALELTVGDRFLELGCGNGDVLFRLAEERGVSGTGVELDPLLFVLVWVRARFTRQARVKILYGNLFDVDFSAYNKIYAYLMKRAYPRLKEKFARELRSGSIVVLAGWPLDDTSPGHTMQKEGETKFYVYRF
jgi:SAM-dependent methyltransferase